MQQADEVVMVDLTPRALLNRLERGVVYPPERAQQALAELLQGADAGRPARAGDAADGAGDRAAGPALTP